MSLVSSKSTAKEAETATALVGPFDARSLCANLRESGCSGEAEWREHASIVEDLLRTLKHEPLQFEDAFALALTEANWTVAECWFLAKKAAREVPSREMREALEAEQDNAQEYLDEFRAERAGFDSAEYSADQDMKMREQLLTGGR